MSDLVRTGGVFLGAGPAGRVALFGAPLDMTASFRPGSRFGPAAIRAASEVLEDWSLTLGRGLSEVPFTDLGDAALAPGDLEGALQVLARVGAELLDGGRLPLALGGEHLVTWPLLRAAADRHPALHLVQLDAHADLRADYMGQRSSHATVMRLCAERLGAGRVHQLGIRSATAEEAAYAAANTDLHPFSVVEPLHRLRDRLAGVPIYLSVDIDVADPAFAPGTGTPEPGGIDARELLAAAGSLAGLQVVAADVVEVAPAYDPGGITAALAAKVVREIILTCGGA